MKIQGILIMAFLLAVPAAALSVEGYAPPDTSRSELVLAEKQYIADKVPPTEIDISTYKNPDGTLTRAYSVKGNVFRYDVDINGKPPYEYRLISTAGNGVFDKKEPLVGEMKVEGKTERYFIDLGPEPGKEYRYSYEKIQRPGIEDQKYLLMGYPIYIPAWVLFNF